MSRFQEVKLRVSLLSLRQPAEEISSIYYGILSCEFDYVYIESTQPTWMTKRKLKVIRRLCRFIGSETSERRYYTSFGDCR